MSTCDSTNKHKTLSEAQTIDFFSRVLCTNQLKLAEYTFLANEKHKKVKNIVQQYKLENKNILSDACEELDFFLYNEFGFIFDLNSKFIFDFFNERCASKPRVCLKVIAKEKVVTIYRNPENKLTTEPFEVNENTAFKEIADGNRKFLCNDIPAAIVDGNYFNTRIIREEALAYQQGSNNRREDVYDYDWIKCWKKVSAIDSVDKVPPPPETCYKSTLVVPMSLLTKDMNQEFAKHLLIPGETHRAILGFLCLDHQNTNFFVEKRDEPLLYFFSDLLSLYFIVQLTNTQYSSIYYQAKELIEKS